MTKKAEYLGILVATLVSLLVVWGLVRAATTISTNITTDGNATIGGNLTVSGTCTGCGGGMVSAPAATTSSDTITGSGNGTTETTLGTTITVPANTFTTGKVYRVNTMHVGENALSTPDVAWDTLVIKLKIGSTVIYSTTLAGNIIPVGTGFKLDSIVDFIPITTGASGHILVKYINSNFSNDTVTVELSIKGINVNTTVAQTISVTGKWTYGAPGSTSTQQALYMYQI